MKDCKGNDIKFGDRVAFTVSTAILTGVAVTGDGYLKRVYGREYDAVRIQLDNPEFTWSYGNRVEKLHRTVFESFRILKLENK